MKSILAALTLAAGFALAAIPTSAAPFSPSGYQSGTSAVEQVQWDERRCRRLRRQCVNKDERGERGEGNCRRYRQQCSRWWRLSSTAISKGSALCWRAPYFATSPGQTVPIRLA